MTGNAPAYYMLNCAHPTHFDGVLGDEPWVKRLRGLRANASTRSHAELDAAPDLDAGDPVALGQQYRALRVALPAAHHPRRLLRHRSPARRADLLRVHGGGAEGGVSWRHARACTRHPRSSEDDGWARALHRPLSPPLQGEVMERAVLIRSRRACKTASPRRKTNPPSRPRSRLSPESCRRSRTPDSCTSPCRPGSCSRTCRARARTPRCRSRCRASRHQRAPARTADRRACRSRSPPMRMPSPPSFT